MANRLQSESSPYLLQHANNPVDWHPWGPKALQKAKDEDKLIIISIGYAACHWCHVMEHESFEDEEVATLMNAHFVCIKVDREERPDIDKVYMDAVVLMTGQGGWPLNCLALPDGRPFSGGTYFPKDRWMSSLTQVAGLYKNNRQRLLTAADNIMDYIKEKAILPKVEQIVDFSPQEILRVCERWLEELDFEHGGRKVNANKFPLPSNNLFLLRAGFFLEKEFGKSEIINKITKSAHLALVKMANGGIYDQLGGGFARYSVDPFWVVPHFEKMLYDNGQLVSLYAEAYAATEDQAQKDLYEKTVRQTLEFVERELTSEEGGFYSSLDADSEGVEGKFYVWTFAELEEALGPDTELFAAFYNAVPRGNWEGVNVLYARESEAEFAKLMNKDSDKITNLLTKGRKKLMQTRAERVRPALDDKILASWNGLMLKGYIKAYAVLGDEKMLSMALKNAHFISNKLCEEGRIWRNYKNGKRSIPGFLDDYAIVADAFLQLYQVTFDEQWVQKSQALLEHVQIHFYDKEGGSFFYTSDEEAELVSRQTELTDDVIPSSTAVLAHCLYDLSLLLDRNDYAETALQLLSNIKDKMLQHPSWHAHWAMLAIKKSFPFFELAITGPKAFELRTQFGQEIYYPNLVLAGAVDSSKLPLLRGRLGTASRIFVCRDKACMLPVSTVSNAAEQLGL